jgi:uncharacterized protein
MLHPHTELRFVGPHMGHGVFATRPIPKGTITWVRCDLDQTLSPERIDGFPGSLRAAIEKYAFIDKHGDCVLCWDNARYVNHSCEATCLGPGYDFEIAVRDIAAGEELTDDYGLLNIDVAFTCRCGSPSCRREIRPDSFLANGDRWDALIADAFFRLAEVEQPLWELVRETDEVARALAGIAPIASCLGNYFRRPRPEPSGSAVAIGAP